MKNIISGDNPYQLTKNVIFVDVPYFDELKPELIIEALKISKEGNNKLWEEIL